MIELGQWDDRIHILRRFMSGVVRRESQGKRGTPVNGQFHRMIEVAVQRLEDGEWIIHGA